MINEPRNKRGQLTHVGAAIPAVKEYFEALCGLNSFDIDIAHPVP